MKKLIACLGAFVLSATSGLTAVSCTQDDNGPIPVKPKTHKDVVNDLISSVQSFARGGVYSLTSHDYKSITKDTVVKELQVAIIDNNDEFSNGFKIVAGDDFTSITPPNGADIKNYVPGNCSFRVKDLSDQTFVKIDGKNDQINLPFLTDQINIIRLLSQSFDNSPQELKINNLTLGSIGNIFSDLTHIAIPDWIFSGVISNDLTLSNIFAVLSEVLTSSGVMPYLMALKGDMPKLVPTQDKPELGDIDPNGSYMRFYNKVDSIIPTLKMFGDNIKHLSDIKFVSKITVASKPIDVNISMDNVLKCIAPDLVHMVNFAFNELENTNLKQSFFLLMLKYLSMPTKNINDNFEIIDANDPKVKTFIHSNLDHILFDILGYSDESKLWFYTDDATGKSISINVKMPLKLFGMIDLGYGMICSQIFTPIPIQGKDPYRPTAGDILDGYNKDGISIPGIMPQLFNYSDITKPLPLTDLHIKNLDSLTVNFDETWQEFIKIWLYKKNINRNILKNLKVHVLSGTFEYDATKDGTNYVKVPTWADLIKPENINFKAYIKNITIRIDTSDANVSQDFAPFDFSVLFD